LPDNSLRLPIQGSVSAAAMRLYTNAADAIGIDTEAILTELGIDLALLKDSRRRLLLQDMERLIARLAELSNDPLFGLHASRFLEPSSFSLVGYIGLNSQSLRDVLDIIPIYETIVGDMGVSSTQVDAGLVYQKWVCRFTDPIARRHEVEKVLASWLRYARDFLLIELAPTAVWFEHAAPTESGILNEYATTFGCDLRFEQPFSALVIPAEQMDLQIQQGDESVAQVLKEHALRVMTELSEAQPTSVRVGNILRMTLPHEKPSSEGIAGTLGISSRTLQRKLNQEGVHFNELVQQIRLELASYYLRNTDHSIERIALALGYGETRSFHRSFKSWTGETAGHFRARLQGKH